METTPRPSRHPELLPYIQNMQMWGALFSMAGGMPHASSAQNPRPMENESLEDLRDSFDRTWAPLRKTVYNALWIIYWNDRYKVAPERGLRVPSSHLWWVVGEGDTVLLSDGLTHHYTTIGTVDREHELVSFADPWPDDFFLQAGRNVLGIESDGCLVRRADFERATAGVLTYDTTDLLDTYFATFPDADDAGQRLRAGFAVMAAGPEYLAGRAVKHFFASARMADLAGDDQAAVTAAARAWLGATCALAAAVGAGDPVGTAVLEQFADTARQRAPLSTLLSRLSPDELCRLAHNVGQLGQLEMLEVATATAIEKDAACEDAYRLRAKARVRAAPVLSVADARRALAINAEATTLLRQEVARLRRPHPGGPTQYKLQREEFRRGDTLTTLVAACWNAGDAPAARQAAVELCAAQPTSASAWHKRLVLERTCGDARGVELAATTLLSLDPSPELRADAEASLISRTLDTGE